LRKDVALTSANSINIARLLPQTFYYFLAAAQRPSAEPLVFSVPSGNFGNLTAGVWAQRMGLPVAKFLAATNRNDTVPSYLRTGRWEPKPSVQTISNAMDVGNPSNFERLQHLFGTCEVMRAHIEGYAYTDSETRQAVSHVFHDTGYVLDPHGAIGYLASRDYRASHPAASCIFLETAHPAKFKETVEEEVGTVDVPERLRKRLTATKQSIKIPALYEALRAHL
ncbi:MAG: pyridoxal-phosphate dependent enzyme, partial [Cyclobacteriaceae bacterium]|nr:pyridoxal-phosphate dependent enzyme [Cyclobacteriaceae bacterium]